MAKLTEMAQIDEIRNKLQHIVEEDDFKGYDPYDALLSPLQLEKMGKWPPVVLIQLLKRLPINIRPALGIPKEQNPKAMGLFLHAYTILWELTGDAHYEEQCHHLFHWLMRHRTEGYRGYGWGYNFPWASSIKYLPAYTPTSVVTGFVMRGIDRYARLFDSPAARYAATEAAEFVLSDIPSYEDESGICFSYTPIEQDICYNASLLAAEVLAIDASLNKHTYHHGLILRAIDFVVSRQKDDGSWYYSMNIASGAERKQIDFHQGYIIESLHHIMNWASIADERYKNAIQKGIDFYAHHQFEKNGKPMYRLPKRWPVDIHNLSQGIITLCRLGVSFPEFESLLHSIVHWGNRKMLNRKGFYNYRRSKFTCTAIPYIRWSHAWMFLALSEYSKYLSKNQ